MYECAVVALIMSRCCTHLHTPTHSHTQKCVLTQWAQSCPEVRSPPSQTWWDVLFPFLQRVLKGIAFHLITAAATTLVFPSPLFLLLPYFAAKCSNLAIWKMRERCDPGGTETHLAFNRLSRWSMDMTNKQSAPKPGLYFWLAAMVWLWFCLRRSHWAFESLLWGMSH